MVSSVLAASPSSLSSSSHIFSKEIGFIEIDGKRFKVTAIANRSINLPKDLEKLTSKVKEIATL